MSLPTPPPAPPPPFSGTPGPQPRLGDMFLPPPPAPPPVHAGRPTLVAGQLTSGWRTLFTAGWIGIVLSLAAVWKSSWTLGFPTWWLGPQSNPRFPLLIALPFVLPMITVVGALRNTRYVVFVGLAAAIGQALIAWGDVGRQDKFALVEFAVAGGGLAVSLASLAGMLRTGRGTGDDAATATPFAPPTV